MQSGCHHVAWGDCAPLPNALALAAGLDSSLFSHEYPPTDHHPASLSKCPAMSPDSEDDLDAIDVQLGHHQPSPLLSHSQANETSLTARLLHHPQPIQGWNTSAPSSPSSSFFFPVSRQLTSDPTQIALPPSPLSPTPSEGESDQQRRLAPAGATYLFGSNHEDIASPSRVLHPTLVRLPSSMPGSCPSSRPGTPSSIASASKDERQCRICFGDGTDEAELGRLISPCVCRGSMRVSNLAHSLSDMVLIY